MKKRMQQKRERLKLAKINRFWLGIIFIRPEIFDKVDYKNDQKFGQLTSMLKVELLRLYNTN